MVDEGTFCTTTEVLRKVGTHASANSSEEIYINQYVKEIEGFLNSLYRGDLISEYAGLEDRLKELLRTITSNLAAIYVIGYDFDGYEARIDAENRITILWTMADMALDEFKKRNTITSGK